ncbi:hypothetical protein BN2537_2991 [Streptomyces venezuelae]|nr:hypothetical protein BN2537_2991 [Streptomyces venezuelae]
MVPQAEDIEVTDTRIPQGEPMVVAQQERSLLTGRFVDHRDRTRGRRRPLGVTRVLLRLVDHMPVRPCRRRPAAPLRPSTSKETNRSDRTSPRRPRHP